MAESIPFHYLGIVRELSYALEGVCYASDFREGLGEFSTEDRERRELANVRVAIGRLRGAYQSLMTREQDMTTTLSLRDQAILKTIPELEKLAEKADGAHLPPELRP